MTTYECAANVVTQRPRDAGRGPPLLAVIEMGQSLNGLKCVKWPEDSCINQLQLPESASSIAG